MFRLRRGLFRQTAEVPLLRHGQRGRLKTGKRIRRSGDSCCGRFRLRTLREAGPRITIQVLNRLIIALVVIGALVFGAIFLVFLPGGKPESLQKGKRVPRRTRGGA